MPATPIDPRLRLLVNTLVVVGVAVAGIYFVLHHSYSLYDDAYIYFRYVDNVAEGCGLRFNCEADPVEGFTSPLYLALLVGARMLTSDLESVSQLIGAVTVIAAVTIAALSVRRHALGTGGERLAYTALALGAGFLLATDDFVFLNAVTGMETALAALLVALLFQAVVDAQARRTGTLVVLALLARPECALFVVLLPLLPWTRNRKFWGGLVASLALIAIARFVVFGDIAPNTYWAKAGGSAVHARLGWAYIVEVFELFPVILLAPLALIRPQSRRPILYFLLVSLLWFGFFLRSGGDTFFYARLAFPLIPILTFLGLFGVLQLVQRLGRPWPLAAGLAPVALLVPALLLGYRAIRSHQLAPSHGFDNVSRWSSVGKYIREHKPNASIATVPIGAIGYFSRAHLIDLVGLTEPAIAKGEQSVPVNMLSRRWIAHERYNTTWVLEQKPDIIIMNKWSVQPWTMGTARAGYYADWQIMRAIKGGQAPYRVLNAEVEPGVFWLMFERIPE